MDIFCFQDWIAIALSLSEKENILSVDWWVTVITLITGVTKIYFVVRVTVNTLLNNDFQ